MLLARADAFIELHTVGQISDAHLVLLAHLLPADYEADRAVALQAKDGQGRRRPR